MARHSRGIKRSSQATDQIGQKESKEQVLRLVDFLGSNLIPLFRNDCQDGISKETVGERRHAS